MGRPAYSEEAVEDIRKAIRERTLSLFHRSGYRTVTLRDIASEMGFSATALYRYFASKDEIIASIRADGFGQMREVLQGARRDSATPLETIRKVGRAYLNFAAREPELYRLLYEFDQGEIAASADVKRERERAFTVAREIAGEAIAAGDLRGDANTAAHLLWVALHGLAALALADQLDLGCSYEDLEVPVLDLLASPIWRNDR